MDYCGALFFIAFYCPFPLMQPCIHVGALVNFYIFAYLGLYLPAVHLDRTQHPQ